MSVDAGMERGVWNQAHLAGFPASPVTFVTGLDKDGSSFVSSGVRVVWSCPSHRIKYPTLVVVCFRSVGFGEWSGCRASNVSEAQQCLLSSAVSTSDAAWIEGRLWWAGWLCKLWGPSYWWRAAICATEVSEENNKPGHSWIPRTWRDLYCWQIWRTKSYQGQNNKEKSYSPVLPRRSKSQCRSGSLMMVWS